MHGKRMSAKQYREFWLHGRRLAVTQSRRGLVADSHADFIQTQQAGAVSMQSLRCVYWPMQMLRLDYNYWVNPAL